MRCLTLFKRIAASIPGAVWLKRAALDWIYGLPSTIPVHRASERECPPPAGAHELLRAYRRSEVAGQSDDFVLYRIIGNDLYPRHVRGQSRKNLRFILENEQRFEGCEKRFVLNRIVDPNEEERIIKLLEDAGFKYIHIPFILDEYRSKSWDIAGVPVEYAPYGRRFKSLSESQQGRILMRLYRYKNNYVINNNGARNAALREGRRVAKWVMPWDGNCFLTERGWGEICAWVCARPEVPYYIVPMARITDNKDLLDPGFQPPAEEEPQIIFRRDTDTEFDPEYFYGRRPKVELFWRLGVRGNWDEWLVEPWDLPCPGYAEQAGCFEWVGWVARLFSGNSGLEKADGARTLVKRGTARVTAIQWMLDQLDHQVYEQDTKSVSGCVIDVDVRRQYVGDSDPLIGRLRQVAEQVLERGPFSVVDKTSLPPSGDAHDYWHPAPYYWPNPFPLPGLPYVRRDGRRVPGTRLYEPWSDKYDRTRLQRLFDDTFVVALAFREFGDEKFADHGASLIRRWFLHPQTAMNPHLEYAQVRWGRNRNRGSGRGLIEFKDMYYFLDAVRIIERAGALSSTECRDFRAWLTRYLKWLVESSAGQSERAAGNNHGTCYDLQVASIAAFLDDDSLLRRTLIDSRFRVIEQIDAEGRQPREMTRSITAHYCCFNLQSWINLAGVADSAGEGLWFFEGPRGQSLEKAMRWLLHHLGRPWPYEQIDEFNHERFYPIYYAYRERYGDAVDCGATVPGVEEITPLFFPHNGIRPFWQLR